MTGLQLAVLSARVELQARAGDDFDGLFYTKAENINLASLFGIGFFAVTAIQDCGTSRFDFSDNHEEARQGFVTEAFDEDGENVLDLVGWPLDEPANVLTMFGQAGLLGLSEAMNPATYFVGGVLQAHRAPLDWLRAGCRGVAVADRRVAARQLLEVPGRIAARDHQHGRELAALAHSLVPQFLAPRRAA